ncbi:MAG TPA: AMP-binding protein, partial [Caulobacteraceae bacterium]|nr:AMP-binding protein [Caulobacteraceae bacterium]
MTLAETASRDAPLTLDRGGFSCWTSETSVRLTREDFWRLAGAYMTAIEAEPRIGGFGLIVAQTSLEMMALFVAMIAAGRQVSFFPPSSTRQDGEAYLEQQREAVLNIGPSSILLFEHGDEALGRIDPRLSARAVRLPRLVPGSADSADRARTGFARALDRDAPLFWQHSSGTTGIKKAVGVTGVALERQFQSYWSRIEANLGDTPPKVASWLPLYHDMGLLAGFLLPLMGGAPLAVMDPFDWVETPQRFLEMIAAEGCSVCWMPNFAFRHYVRLRRLVPRHELNSMRLWISCSEPCRYADALAFEAAYADLDVREGAVLGCYAMAETVFAVSQLDAGAQQALIVPRGLEPGASVAAAGGYQTRERTLDLEPKRQAVLSSGATIPGVEAKVFVNGEATVGEGVYGEIGLEGGFVFEGYRGLGREESNLRPDGVYMTGDLGAVIGGQLYVFGRSKEIIIVNGKNLYAGDVEERAGSVPGVRPGRVAAFGLANPALGTEELIVVVERDPAAALTDEAIRAGVIAQVSDAFLVKPHDVRLIDGRWLVKTTSGKVSRTRNKAKYLRDFRPDLA